VGQRGDAVCGNVGRSLRGNDNPAPRGSQRAKKARKVTNLKEVAPVSRENGCVQHDLCPGAPATRSACDRVEKAREGQDANYRSASGEPGKKPRRGKIPRGHPARVWLNPKHGVRDPRDEQSPEAAMRRSRRIQSREGHGARKGVRRSGGSKASKGEPQERNRDETSPAGREGSKASEG